MYYTKIVFKRINETPVTDDDELLWFYSSLLYRNGQIYREYELVSNENEYMLFATMPEKDSLDNKYNTLYINEKFDNLKNKFNISHEIIGINKNCADVCKCETQEWYVLYAAGKLNGGPIYCGNCMKPVPLYKFSETHVAKEYIDTVSWQASYKAMDILWIYGIADRFTYKQMHNPKSSLMDLGRIICEGYESLTGKPFYLYLFQYYKTRKFCPICGADWECKDKESIIDYKCDICKLVSDKKGKRSGVWGM
jgi:predicted  nucleic acid-binding Zn ribbon protein